MIIKQALKGRLVWGHPAHEVKIHTYDDPKKGTPLIDSKGNPYSEYTFGVAVLKTAPEFTAFKAELSAIAASAYPDGSSQRMPFAWKITDGDNPMYAKKKGYPGHWIMNFKSINRMPKIYKHDGCTWLEMPEPLQNLKTGDYVWATGSAAGNGMTGNQAGIFMNAESIAFVGYGEAIVTGQTAVEAFGTAAPTLPQGATTVPSGTPPASVAATAPAPDMKFVQGPGTAAPTLPWVMTLKAGTMTQASLVALGIDEVNARTQGYIL